jgi:hypothetical protein
MGDPDNLTTSEQTAYVSLANSDSSYMIADLATWLDDQTLTPTLLVNWYCLLQLVEREKWIAQIRLWLSEVGGGDSPTQE